MALVWNYLGGPAGNGAWRNMHPISKQSIAMVMAVGGLLLGADARGETITVGAGGITTLQEAVDAALDNADAVDTILVPKGDMTETVVVDYTAGTGAAQTGLTIQRKNKSGQVLIVGAAGVALSILNSTNVVVKNIDLQSSSAADGTPALLVNTCQNLLFKNVNGVAGDDLGVIVTNSNSLGIRFEKCDFSGMLGIGFSIDGFGHELKKCAADGCGLNGVVFTTQALNCWIIDSSIVATGGLNAMQPGVLTLRGNGHRIVNTTIGGGGLQGVYAVGAGHVLDGCSSNDNTNAGYRIDDAEVKLENCSASGNANGVEGGGLGAAIIGGKYNANTLSGIRLSAGGANVRDTAANNNGGDGLLVTAASAGTNIRDCSFKKNGGDGINVVGQLTWVEGNTAKGGDGLIDAGTNNSGRDNVVKNGGTNDF